MSTQPLAGENRAGKSKKPAANPPGAVGAGAHSGPTTFFLCSERDLEKSAAPQRGRKASRSGVPSRTEVEDEPLKEEAEEEEEESSAPLPPPPMADSTFGVESLADTINSAFSSSVGLSPTSSGSDGSGSGVTGVGGGADSVEPSLDASPELPALTGRKRKAGKPALPALWAPSGRRIMTSEQPSAHASSLASPVSLRSSESPFRTRLRRASVSSSSLGQFTSEPMTPLRMSPQPESAMPSTPRSGSPKSFRLSDEEGSVADETASQAVQSSNGDEDDAAATAGATGRGRGPSSRSGTDGSMPQLVMPSIAIPTRRPFTERGRRMDRLKVLVVGRDGVGKSSLIHNICRLCADVVHVDPPGPSTLGASGHLSEIHASTRPYPAWWSDFERRRTLLRRASVGDGVLERNLCFIDTPGIHDEVHVQHISRDFDVNYLRTARLEQMTDSEVVGLLSGEGGVQIDAVLWLFGPHDASELAVDGLPKLLFQKLCRFTNVIPLIGHADMIPPEDVSAHKRAIASLIERLPAETYHFDYPGAAAAAPEDSVASTLDKPPAEPLAVSSAMTDDAEEVDASVLMSSQYMQPLVPSELAYLVERLLDPDNIARLRHLSARKFILWRQHSMGHRVDRPKLKSTYSPSPLPSPPLAPPPAPTFGHTLPSVTSTGSLLDEPSQVLVPHSTSSFYSSASPAASDVSAPLSNQGVAASTYALAQYNEQNGSEQPFRQVRLAKWAQDLQRGIDNERKRYQQMYTSPPAEWTTGASSPAADEKALLFLSAEPHSHPHSHHHHRPGDLDGPPCDPTTRPARGRLGGDLAVIDPRDPLGVLAFSQTFGRQGWAALQVAGGMGLLGAAAWWILRNWVGLQEWLGVAGPVVSARAMPARGAWGDMQDGFWRALGWAK